jgi:hypothetical protein
LNPFASKLVWWFEKRKWLADALLFGRGPDFVVERKLPENLGHIPVFTFHVAEPKRFEAQCAHLAENQYHTIDASELEKVMRGELKPQARSVAITFDDGLKQVWSVAFPILKKYGLKAIVFLVPGCIPEERQPPRKSLFDVWEGSATEQEVFGIWPGEPPLATWTEICEMHESGLVDFQSHSMWHSLVFRSNSIVDFGRPGYDKHYFGNVHVPIYQSDSVDQTDRELLLGMPIYTAAPRFQVQSRFFDDEGLREHCVEFVSANGGIDFFEDKGWPRELMGSVRKYRDSHSLKERFETPEERDANIEAELNMARDAIELRLKGKSVTHLCFPWYKAADFARSCAWNTGHKLVYSDYDKDCQGNVAGSGSKSIARVDECFLRRLPGTGRISKAGVIREIVQLRNLPRRMFPGDV